MKFVLFCHRVSCCVVFRCCWWFVWFVFSLDSIGLSLFSWLASQLDSLVVSTECAEQATSVSKTNNLKNQTNQFGNLIRLSKGLLEMRWDLLESGQPPQQRQPKWLILSSTAQTKPIYIPSLTQDLWCTVDLWPNLSSMILAKRCHLK